MGKGYVGRSPVASLWFDHTRRATREARAWPAGLAIFFVFLLLFFGAPWLFVFFAPLKSKKKDSLPAMDFRLKLRGHFPDIFFQEMEIADSAQRLGNSKGFSLCCSHQPWGIAPSSLRRRRLRGAAAGLLPLCALELRWEGPCESARWLAMVGEGGASSRKRECEGGAKTWRRGGGGLAAFV